MKTFHALVAVMAIVSLTTVAAAQGPGKPGKPGAGKGGADNPAARGARGPGAGQRDPARMVEMMMQRFDSDGDQKLDATELEALLTALRDRNGQAAGPRRRGPQGNGPAAAAAGKNPEQMRQRRGAGDGQNQRPGGQKPKRPQAEDV